MRFVWDEKKQLSNIRKHGIDFADVPAIFELDTVTVIDDRFEYGEIRYQTLGLLTARGIMVVHTESETIIRIISARMQTNMKKKSTSVKSKTDFARLDKMKDEDIDYSDAPAMTPEMFAKAIVRRGLKPRTKTQLTLRVDSDVLDWFKKQGRGYQTRINLLLRAYMQEHQR